MKLDVALTPGELAASELAGRTAVVVDVLRATSTMVEALANGARSIFPVATADDAVRLARNLERPDLLLCGERRLVRVEGFDLGNSPREFTSERVTGKLLVMSTTNGTPAFATAATASRAVAAAFVNLSAVAETVAGDEAVTIICAGRGGRFALEDALCAGSLALLLEQRAGRRLDANDAARAAIALARRGRRSLARLLARTAAGRDLIAIGYRDDVALCAEVDRRAVVPQLREGQLSL